MASLPSIFKLVRLMRSLVVLVWGTFNEFMDNDQFNVTLVWWTFEEWSQSGSADPDDNRFESLVQASAYLTEWIFESGAF